MDCDDYVVEPLISPLRCKPWKYAGMMRDGCVVEPFTSTDVPTPQPPPRTLTRYSCKYCGTKPTMQRLKLCSGCLSERYCGKQCQTEHWKYHKPVCRKTCSGCLATRPDGPALIVCECKKRQYCGEECQEWDWFQRHQYGSCSKLLCFPTAEAEAMYKHHLDEAAMARDKLYDWKPTELAD